jgi:hypothetical protein
MFNSRILSTNIHIQATYEDKSMQKYTHTEGIEHGGQCVSGALKRHGLQGLTLGLPITFNNREQKGNADKMDTGLDAVYDNRAIFPRTMTIITPQELMRRRYV